MTHLELTTSIGPGGWDRLTREQRCDAMAWHRVHTGPMPEPPPPPQETEHERRLRLVRERLGPLGVGRG